MTDKSPDGSQRDSELSLKAAQPEPSTIVHLLSKNASERWRDVVLDANAAAKLAFPVTEILARSVNTNALLAAVAEPLLSNAAEIIRANTATFTQSAVQAINASLQNVVARATESLNLHAQNAIAAVAAQVVQPMFADVMTQLAASRTLEIANVFGKMFDRIRDDEELMEAFRDSGWPIAPSMDEEIRERLRALKRQGRLRYATTAILGFYHKNDYKVLRATVGGWNSQKLYSQRAHIFSDALRAHTERRYALSVPAVYPHIEGILTAYVKESGLTARLSKIKEVYSVAIGDMDDFDFTTWVIANTLLYQLQNSTYVYADFEKEVGKALRSRSISRHTVLHGVSVNYNTASTSLKAFVILDAIHGIQRGIPAAA